MLTLEELKKVTAVADTNERVPSPKALRESGVHVIVREIINENTDVTVYENGFVLYRSAGHVTVFPLHSCGEYHYTSVAAPETCIPAEYFEHEWWYLRLLLEGEDRISQNSEKIEQLRNLSYSVYAEEWILKTDSLQNPLEKILHDESVQELLDAMTDNQRRVVIRCYLEREPQVEVASKLKISPQAVSDLLVNGICRIRKLYGIEDRRLKRKNKKDN